MGFNWILSESDMLSDDRVEGCGALCGHWAGVAYVSVLRYPLMLSRMWALECAGSGTPMMHRQGGEQRNPREW